MTQKRSPPKVVIPVRLDVATLKRLPNPEKDPGKRAAFIRAAIDEKLKRK
jgi:hypothetical protein